MGSKGIVHSFLTLALYGSDWYTSWPSCFTAKQQWQYPTNRKQVTRNQTTMHPSVAHSLHSLCYPRSTVNPTYEWTNMGSQWCDNANCVQYSQIVRMCACVCTKPKTSPEHYYSTVQITLMHTHNTPMWVSAKTVLVCECQALASLRHEYLGSFFLDPQDIKSLSPGAIWNFSKGTVSPWTYIRLYGTKGSLIKA